MDIDFNTYSFTNIDITPIYNGYIRGLQLYPDNSAIDKKTIQPADLIVMFNESLKITKTLLYHCCRVLIHYNHKIILDMSDAIESLNTQLQNTTRKTIPIDKVTTMLRTVDLETTEYLQIINKVKLELQNVKNNKYSPEEIPHHLLKLMIYKDRLKSVNFIY